jgi:hypothetical protein
MRFALMVLKSWKKTFLGVWINSEEALARKKLKAQKIWNCHQSKVSKKS